MTCNLNDVSETTSRPGAYCSAKGRMHSSFQLACSDRDNYFLRMRRPLVASSLAVLAKYIVFSKAEQINACDNFVVFGLFGEKVAAAIKKSFGSSPNSLHHSVCHEGNIALQRDDEGNCFECWIKIDAVATFWPILSDGLTLQGSQSWELLMIRQGLGDVTEATVDSFIPQMLNFHTIGAVSFSKGCYTGQEVVARMQYKGKLKRHMYPIRIDGKNLSAGDSLYEKEQKQSIGTIVNSVALDTGGAEALAVITIKDVQNNHVIVWPNGAGIEVLSLPYAIT
jgi:folate-binding protein YgfZ